jgi:hypothetical protein
MAESGGDDHEDQFQLIGIPAAARKSFAAQEEIVEVFADNWPALMVFLDMQTQWHEGFAGPTGLVYASLPEVYRKHGIRRAEQADAFEGVQTMERETLAVWREQAKRKARQ